MLMPLVVARSVLVFEMHNVDPLAGMPGTDVGHHVGRLLATKLAVGTLEPRRLAALIFQVSCHVPFNREAPSALGATERLPEAIRERSFSIVIRQRPRYGCATGIPAGLPGATVGLERLARL